MFSFFNLSLLSLRASQLSFSRSQISSPSYFSISRSTISRNLNQPFYSEFNDAIPSTKSCHVYKSHFSHFLVPVFSILNGPDSDFNRQDIYNQQPTINLKAPNLTVYESLFSDCKGKDGGVFFVVFEGDVIIEKTNFINCSAEGKGGVIFYYGSILTITQSCFTSCTSTNDGFSIFAARSKAQATIEQTHFYLSEGGKSSTVFIEGFDIITKNLNCTNSAYNEKLNTDSEDSSVLATAFFLSPMHFFSFEMNEINNNSGFSLLHLANLDQVDSIQNINIINCNIMEDLNSASLSNSMLFFTQGTVVFRNWAIVINDEQLKSQYMSKPLSFMDTDDSSTLDIDNSYFSLSKTCFSFNTYVTLGSSVNFDSSNQISLKEVSSKGCWAQSRFIFQEPKTYKKVIVALVVAALFIVGFAFLIYEACQDQKEHKELLQQTQNNEMLNETYQKIQVQDLQKLAKKQQAQNHLLAKGENGEGELSD